MGKASTNKKVAKAAGTGGGRTRRGGSSMLFPSVMAVVVILGLALVVVSRGDKAEADNTPPRAGADHWHAAIGFYVCGNFLPNVTDQNDPRGIHTHGDGVMHIHPFTDRSGGRNATLGVFFEAIEAKVTASSLRIPGTPEKKNGQKCDGRQAEVQTVTWDFDGPPEAKPTPFEGDPSALKPSDRSLVTVAFMPKGTEIPRPPSADQLNKLTDIAPAQAPPSPPGEAEVLPPPGEGEAPPPPGEPGGAPPEGSVVPAPNADNPTVSTAPDSSPGSVPAPPG